MAQWTRLVISRLEVMAIQCYPANFFRSIWLRKCVSVDSGMKCLLPVDGVIPTQAPGLANGVLMQFRYVTGQDRCC